MTELPTIYVRTPNPKALVQTIQQFGGVVEQNCDLKTYRLVKGCYVIRCFGNSGFLKFAIKNEGYAEVVDAPSQNEPCDSHSL